jgi:hypothetical protein
MTNTSDYPAHQTRLANEYGINSYVATLPPRHSDDHYDYGTERRPAPVGM